MTLAPRAMSSTDRVILVHFLCCKQNNMERGFIWLTFLKVRKLLVAGSVHGTPHSTVLYDVRNRQHELREEQAYVTQSPPGLLQNARKQAASVRCKSSTVQTVSKDGASGQRRKAN